MRTRRRVMSWISVQPISVQSTPFGPVVERSTTTLAEAGVIPGVDVDDEVQAGLAVGAPEWKHLARRQAVAAGLRRRSPVVAITQKTLRPNSSVTARSDGMSSVIGRVSITSRSPACKRPSIVR